MAVSIIRVPPSSGSISPSAAFLDYLTVECEATTIRRNVGNHPPSDKSSHARTPNAQTQRHYKIKSRNIEFVLPPLNKFCRHTVTLHCHKCSVIRSTVFCVLMKSPCISGRLWTCDLWQCVHYVNRHDPEVTRKPLDALCILTIATLSGHWSTRCHT